MPSTSFPPYPPAQKPKSRKDFMTMVSNVSARKKWLMKYAPEWNGGEIWSEKQVKRYIHDVTYNRVFLPVAKKIKIPYAWNCEIIPVLVVVSEIRETEAMNQISSLYSSQVPTLDMFCLFISHMERFDAFME
jgi:hypothetical protein